MFVTRAILCLDDCVVCVVHCCVLMIVTSAMLCLDDCILIHLIHFQLYHTIVRISML